MNKKMGLLLTIFCLAFVASNASAISFTDNFSGYENYYKVIDYTSATGVTIGNDANAAESRGILTDGNNSFTIPVDVSKNAANSAQAIKLGIPKVNLSDYNSNGRLYFHFIPDNVATISRVDIRLGHSTGNYYEYRVNTPWDQSIYLGEQIMEYDLNAADATVGTPNLADVNYYQITVNYGAGQTDFNFTINKIWVEKPGQSLNGGTNNVWQVLNVSGTPDGWAIPFNYTNEGFGLSVMDNNDSSLGSHGRVFIPQFDYLDLSTRNITIQSDINQVDTNWGTRILFDAVNFSPGDNFSSCFIADITSTSRRIGVEQWVNGTRSFTQKTYTMNYGDYNTLTCVITGDIATVYVDGQIAASQEVIRKDGRIGIESFGGRTHIQNFSLSIEDKVGDSSNLYGMGLNILMPLLIVLVLVKTKEDGETQNFSLAIQLALVWVVLQALFFGV